MFIIPFIEKKTQLHNMIVTSIHIFTVGGTKLWEEDNSFTVQDVLTANDIFVSDPPKFKNGIYFCKVDPITTNMADFYKWEEVTDDTFCWRTFYFFGKDSYSGWLPLPHDMLGNYTYQEVFDLITASK